MPIRRLVEEFERIKWDGGFDQQIFDEINLTLKLTDREIEDVDFEATKERARELFDVTFFQHLKRRYPDLF